MHNEETTQPATDSVPNVWLVRGGRTSEYVKALVSNGYVGFRFEVANMNLSRVESKAEIRDLYLRENAPAEPATPEQKGLVTWYVNRLSWFVFDVKIGDYVIMPETSRTRVVHYGTVRSDVYHVAADDGLPFRNRRTVAWQGRFTREDKPALRRLFDRSEAVWPVDDKEKLAFFAVLLGR